MCDPRAMPTPIDAADVRWYQRAVFYEVAVRGFCDSDGDGFGDFTGLTRKLDYLQWLGIDCLWLLPFYQSPLKDGGYDISDFVTVLPESGTVDDVAVFLDESHRRGIRVIADMVVNHTSDLHPWFQESRQDRTNPKADWYVWGDDSERWGEARVIFVDSEPSNWTWDPQREQFYWHRFFHHQPDLNYDNPEVAEAMLDVVRFWLGLGLDGFRLDAVPYLFEPDGTQWGIFLRNHDELTLEMVSDEDRDYMYSEYATDPRMKLNLGIRRRLFPLLENDEGMAELFHAMLFSMPGSPVMYYGDEIGMGDNIYLGDRDGVRTPMQWSPDRNAGFSSADFARLFLPPLMDPVYGYQAVNVEAQQRDPSSFLQWIRRMLAVRRQHPVLAMGEFETLHAQNPSVLAYLRRGIGADGEEDIVLCVNNLSRFPQPVELMMEQLAGKVPVELTGRVPFPAIGELPYFVTLAPHGFYWFRLQDGS